MLEEIREQPDTLDGVISDARSFIEKAKDDLHRFKRIRFVGCGDMDFSSRIAAWLAAPNKTRVEAHRSMDMRWKATGLGKDDLVVCASFSGRTPRTIEAALLSKRSGASIFGITGNGESPFAKIVDRIMLLHTGPAEELTRHDYAGYHHNVPQTKTFTAVLLAQLILLKEANLLAPQLAAEIDILPEALRKGILVIEKRVAAFMDNGFSPMSRVSVLGAGPYRAIADYSAAKFMEMAIPGRSQCMEENNHLEMFLTDKDEFIIFLAPDRESWTRAKELLDPYEEFGANRLVVGPSSVIGCEGPAMSGFNNAYAVATPEGGWLTQVFFLITALQLISASVGPALGRNIDIWVGGVRTELIEKMGHNCVRASKIQG